MIKLKIDPELRDFLPPPSEEERGRLEKSLLDYGYDSKFPIYTWNGYIVDGHNRYEFCKKHNIEFAYEDPFSDKSFDKDTIKLWMSNNQLTRRNLTKAQRAIIVLKEEDIVRRKAKEKQGLRNDLPTSSPHGEKVRTVHTDKELAEKAGVGQNTIYRVRKVMKSDNEDLKNKLKNGEIQAHTAFEQLKESSGREEEVIEYGITDNTPNTKLPEAENHNDDVIISNQKEYSIKNTVANIIADIKTDKTINDCLNLSKEIEWMRDESMEYIDGIEDKFFTVFNIEDCITKNEQARMIEVLNETIESVKNLIKKIKKIKGDR